MYFYLFFINKNMSNIINQTVEMNDESMSSEIVSQA